MATRSTIAIQNADGTVTGIYCHNDGYLSHNGAILENYYNDENIVRQLIGLGDLSSLGETIGNKVSFGDYDARRGQCVAYARDRGETGVEAETKVQATEFLVAKGLTEDTAKAKKPTQTRVQDEAVLAMLAQGDLEYDDESDTFVEPRGEAVQVAMTRLAKTKPNATAEELLAEVTATFRQFGAYEPNF